MGLFWEGYLFRNTRGGQSRIFRICGPLSKGVKRSVSFYNGPFYPVNAIPLNHFLSRFLQTPAMCTGEFSTG